MSNNDLSVIDSNACILFTVIDTLSVVMSTDLQLTWPRIILNSFWVFQSSAKVEMLVHIHIGCAFWHLQLACCIFQAVCSGYVFRAEMTFKDHRK